jgi:uncharacterized DUF497 family protein
MVRYQRTYIFHELRMGRQKERRKLREAGFGFDYAVQIFGGAVITSVDDRKDYKEIRIQAIGAVSDDVLFVVYTMRGEDRRIISARLASRKERQKWLARR